MRHVIVGLSMLLVASTLASCAGSGARNPVCPVLESLGFPADVAPIAAGTDTETTVIAANEYGLDECGWQPFAD